MFCVYCGSQLPTGWQVFGMCPNCRRCLPDIADGDLAMPSAVRDTSTSSSAALATSSAPLTYETFLQSYKQKECDRRTKFGKKKRHTEPDRCDVRIQIGRMNGKLQPVRGTRLPIIVSKFAKCNEVLSAGVAKLSAHDKKFPEHCKPSLRYPDGSLVDTLPEGDAEFNLDEYRQQIGKDFQRIVLFVAVDVEGTIVGEYISWIISNDGHTHLLPSLLSYYGINVDLILLSSGILLFVADCDEVTVDPTTKISSEGYAATMQFTGTNVTSTDINITDYQVQIQKKLLLIGPPSKVTAVNGKFVTPLNEQGELVLVDDDCSDDNCGELPNFNLPTNTSSNERSSLQLYKNNRHLPLNTAYDNYVELFDSDTDIECPDANQTSSELELHCSSEPFDSLTLTEVLQPVIDNIHGESQVIIAHRRFIMTSFRRATCNPDFSFCRPCTILFSGEDAEDEGGPRREFFRLLMKEIDETIFAGPTGYRTFTYSLNLYHENVYKLAGQAMQYSIALGGPALPVFNGKYFKFMLGQGSFDVDDCDIDAITEDSARDYLRKIYASNTEEEFQCALASCADWLLDYSFIVQKLKLSDKAALLRTVVVHLLFNRYTPAFEQFKSGMSDLWSIVVNHPDVTKNLFVHFPDSLTFRVLRKLYDIEWSDDQSNRRLMEQDTIFSWELFIQKCDSSTQCTVTMKDLLVFWTGAESIPPLGFPERLKIAFYTREIMKMADGTTQPERRLPSSSTCSLTIFLPRGVGQPNELETMIHDAINLSAGFGKI